MGATVFQLIKKERMLIKQIKNATNYLITSNGVVFNSNTGREVTQHRNGKKDYSQVIITDNEGKRKKFYVHRLVAEAFIPNKRKEAIEVGHLKTKRDNDIDSLCWCTPVENREYMRDTKPFTSKYLGVCWNKKSNKWIAAISIDGKYTWLGAYNTEEEAAAAVKYARTNGRRP